MVLSDPVFVYSNWGNGAFEQVKQVFSYTDAIWAVVEDICAHVPQFAHVKPAKILVSFAQARKRTNYGIFAKIVPLRLEGGVLEQRSGSKVTKIPRWTYKGKEYLYILYVYLPRFHDQSFDEKILILMHELFHISPLFNGWLRTFGRNKSLHGPSSDEYDARLKPFVDFYMKERGRASCLDFLRIPSNRLESTLGRMTGLQIRMPTFWRE